MSVATANSRKTPEGRPWPKGVSGNPSGRPKGIARAARDAIGDDPTRLTAIFLEIAEDPQAKDADRIAAAERYLDRAYGKSPAHAPVEGGDPLERDDLSRRIGTVLDELADKRTTRTAGDGEPGAVAATG